ncbi:MAG TPA: HEAT repeat domain-containing protein [Verrucomicrobiae bacterium]
MALSTSSGESASSSSKDRKNDTQTAVTAIREAITLSRDTNTVFTYKAIFQPIDPTITGHSYEERKLTGAGKVSVVSLSSRSAAMTGYKVTEEEAERFFQSLIDAGIFTLPTRWTSLSDPLLRKVPIQAPYTQSPDFAPGYELEMQVGDKRIKTAFPVYDRPTFPPSSASKIVKLVEAFFDRMEERVANERSLRDLHNEALKGYEPDLNDLPSIRSGLKSNELTNRIVSAARLSLLAEKTNLVQECISILDDPNEHVRNAAETGLRKTGTNAVSSTPQLSNLLRRHSRESVREIAARTLLRGDPQDPEIRNVLLHGLKDPSPKVRDISAAGLSKFHLQSPEHWEQWHSILVSPEYRTNAAALGLLPIEWIKKVPATQHARLVGDLMKLLVNDTEEIRSLAVYRLQPLLRSDASIQSAVIERMQKDTAHKVRYAALLSIRNSLYDSSEWESLLVQAATDPFPEIKAYAMEALAQQSRGKALSDDMLLEGINSSDWSVRINSAWLLTQRKRPEAVPVLLDEMEQNGDRRAKTAEYLAQFGPDVLPLIRPQLNSLKIPTVKSLLGYLALANIKEAAPDILAATRHADPGMRAHALKALGWLKLDNADVRTACETLRNDPDETVRKQAEDTIAFLDRIKPRKK